MNNEKMGQFIAELRKSNQMTQKDLASKLDITDKAVSKWERGLSSPDISLLSTLADTFGVTVGELLNGEKNEIGEAEAPVNIDNVLQYADKTTNKKVRSMRNVWAIIFSILLLTGILVCTICDLAISGTITWAAYPIASIVFAWLIFIPVIKFGTKGIYGSVIALSVIIIPYLCILNALIPMRSLLLPVGIRAAVIWVVYLWIVIAVFRVLKTRKLIAAAISLVFMIPAHLIMNFSLAKLIHESAFDVWDMVGFFIVIALALILTLADAVRNRRRV